MSDALSQAPETADTAAPGALLGPYPGPLVVLVKLRTRPDKITAARQALEKITEPTRANPDCLELRVFQDRDDPRSFTLLEHWTSLEANQAHAARDYMAEYMAAKDEIFEDISGEFIQELDPPTPAA
ncbi:antibiotic biosynthesis monooxygenase [Streptomyces sp. NBC_01317]|uniref:putative quinol monooxygenase n=1 Tax=Streptomyces sp. NBC_01317 TaxID=2903822 RepID=UPI002E15A5F0|nr:antibiotic biosynthesis monooxygenase [Streptomyces sp. NBC_01317]